MNRATICAAAWVFATGFASAAEGTSETPSMPDDLVHIECFPKERLWPDSDRQHMREWSSISDPSEDRFDFKYSRKTNTVYWPLEEYSRKYPQPDVKVYTSASDVEVVLAIEWSNGTSRIKKVSRTDLSFIETSQFKQKSLNRGECRLVKPAF